MAIAVAQVKQIIEIKGVDNASDAVRKAQASLKGLEKTAKDTSEAASSIDLSKVSKDAGQASGKIETALKAVGDFAGSSEGAVKGLGDAFGSIEAVTSLLPGPIGLAATAVGALGAATYLAAKAADEAQARYRFAFGPERRAELDGVRTSLGLSRDQVIRFGQALDDVPATLRPSVSLLEEVRVRAEAIGIDGQEAVAKFVEEWRQGGGEIAKSLGLLNDFKKSLGALSRTTGIDKKFFAGIGQEARDELQGAEARLKAEREVLATMEGKRAGEIRHLHASAKLSDRILAGAIEKGAVPAALVAQRALYESALVSTRKAREAVVDEALTAQDVETSRENKAAEDERRRAAAVVDARTAADRRAATAAAKAGAAAAKAREERRDRDAKAEAATAKAAVDAAKKLEEQAAEVAKRDSEARATAELSASNAVAEARKKESTSLADVLRARGEFARAAAVEAAQDAADRSAEIVRIEASIEARRKEAAGPGGGGADVLASLKIERMARLDAAEAEFDAKTRTRQEQAEKRTAEATAKLSGQIASAAQIVQGPAAKLGGTFGEAAAAAATGVQQVASSWKGLGQSAPGAIAAAGAVAGAFVEGEQAKAAVAAITEAAASAASFAIGDIPGGVGHAAAAVLYAGVAGGAIGGGGGGAAGGAGAGAGGGGGGFAAPSSGTAPAGQQGPQGQAIVINFNAPLTTRQEIGKGVQLALRSLSTTGLPKAKGA